LRPPGEPQLIPEHDLLRPLGEPHLIPEHDSLRPPGEPISIREHNSLHPTIHYFLINEQYQMIPNHLVYYSDVEIKSKPTRCATICTSKQAGKEDRVSGC
jgi:hypothetical protein